MKNDMDDLSPLVLGDVSSANINDPLYFMSDDDPSRGLNQNNFTGVAYNSVTRPNHVETAPGSTARCGSTRTTSSIRRPGLAHAGELRRSRDGDTTPWCQLTKAPHMARLTISLSDERHRALREAAATRHKTIGQLIEESLEFYGIKTSRNAEELVAKARARASLSEADANRVAVAETRAARRR